MSSRYGFAPKIHAISSKAHRTLSLLAGAFLFCLGAGSSAAEDLFKGHELTTKFRIVSFDRDFENSADDREQTAIAIQADYTSPQFWNAVGVGLSGYVVEKLNAGGADEEDVLTLDADGNVDGFGLLGQAYLNFTLGDSFSSKIGRQVHKSIFLNSSTSRAVPNTFQGVSAKFQPLTALSIYGAVYNKWSRRSSDSFEGFATDVSQKGDISYVGLLGFEYEIGPFTVEFEYLESKEFLRKFGLRGTYVHHQKESRWRFTGGIFTSSDAGNLFVTGSEGDHDDEDVAGSTPGVTPSGNDGLGGYIEAAWKKGNVELSGALTLIDEIWLEDNYTGDHGRNPFPTRTRIGPDLTNTGETVISLRLDYDWKDFVAGLKMDISAGFGFDAENSVDSSLGTADENWFRFRLTYEIPAVEGMKFTGIFHTYNSDETGSVDGVKEDERDIRLYLDYVYTWK